MGYLGDVNDLLSIKFCPSGQGDGVVSEAGFCEKSWFIPARVTSITGLIPAQISDNLRVARRRAFEKGLLHLVLSRRAWPDVISWSVLVRTSDRFLATHDGANSSTLRISFDVMQMDEIKIIKTSSTVSVCTIATRAFRDKGNRHYTYYPCQQSAAACNMRGDS